MSTQRFDRTIPRWWRSIHPVLRRSAIGFWSTGALFAALGVLGDELSWWTDRPFLTNLVSTFTGAALGIPVALLVLQQLAAIQARTNVADAIVRSARTRVSELSAAFGELRAPAAADSLAEMWKVMDELAAQSRLLAESNPGPATSALGAHQSLDRLANLSLRAVKLVRTNLPDPEQWSATCRRISYNWYMLHSVLRPRLYEQGLMFLHDSVVTDGEDILRRLPDCVPKVHRAADKVLNETARLQSERRRGPSPGTTTEPVVRYADAAEAAMKLALAFADYHRATDVEGFSAELTRESHLLPTDGRPVDGR